MKCNPYYWYLSITILLLGFEGVFTMTIKDSPEWKFFNPTIFLYLARSVFLPFNLIRPIRICSSVCPSIWLIELDKLDARLVIKEAREAFLNSNLTTLPPTTTQGQITFQSKKDYLHDVFRS